MTVIATYINSLSENDFYKAAYRYYNEDDFHKVKKWVDFLNLCIENEAGRVSLASLSQTIRKSFEDAYKKIEVRARRYNEVSAGKLSSAHMAQRKSKKRRSSTRVDDTSSSSGTASETIDRQRHNSTSEDSSDTESTENDFTEVIQAAISFRDKKTLRKRKGVSKTSVRPDADQIKAKDEQSKTADTHIGKADTPKPEIGPANDTKPDPGPNKAVAPDLEKSQSIKNVLADGPAKIASTETIPTKEAEVAGLESDTKVDVVKPTQTETALPEKPVASAEEPPAAVPKPEDPAPTGEAAVVTSAPEETPNLPVSPVHKDRYYEGAGGRWVVNAPGKWRNKSTGRLCNHGPAWVRPRAEPTDKKSWKVSDYHEHVQLGTDHIHI